MEKACKTCGQIKPMDGFHNDRQRPDGKSINCKPCLIAKHKEYDKRPRRAVTPEGTHWCGRCKSVKPLDEFHNHKGTFNGKADQCKDCAKKNRKPVPTERNKAYSLAWRLANPVLYKDFKRRTHYGVPLGWYDEQLARQGGKCAICGSTDSRRKGCDFAVDHCHDTKAVRGLLCHPCNMGIGFLDHDEVVLSSAIRYLAVGPAKS